MIQTFMKCATAVIVTAMISLSACYVVTEARGDFTDLWREKKGECEDDG